MRLPSAWQPRERVEFVRFPPASPREVEVGHTMGDVKISRRLPGVTVVICPRTRVGWRFRWDVFWNVLRGIILVQFAARVGSLPVLSLIDECDFPHVATRISSA